MSRRVRLSWLALLFVACAAYGSLVPLRWRPIGWTEGLRRAAAIPVEPVWHVFNGDFFTNVLVFLPIGFFAAGALAARSTWRADARDRWRSVAVAAAVLVGCAVLSLLIELGQVYVRDRTPSWSDVYAQALGGLAGAVLWTLVGLAAIEWVAGALRAPSRDDRVLRLLGLYAAAWTIYGMVPMAFPRLAHPLLPLWTARLELPRLVLAGPMMVAGLSAMPVGAWAALACARPGRRWSAGPLAAAGVGVLFLADRVRQVAFMPADGHLAAGLVGYSIGWLFVATGAPRVAGSTSRTSKAVLVSALAAVLALVVLLYWAPFNFGVAERDVNQRIRVLYQRAPFHRYYWLPPLVALGEVTTLAVLSMGTSLLVALAFRGRQRVLAARTPVLVTTLIFTVVEWGQLYLPWRRADPTDVLIGTLGALAGVTIARALDSRSLEGGVSS